MQASTFGNLSRPRRTSLALLAAAIGAAALAAGCGSSSSSSGTTTSGSNQAAALHAHHQTGLLALAATYLGTERAKIRADLHEGKTLAEIADATPGHSANGLIEFAVGVRRERLETLAHEGQLSQQQLTARDEQLRTRIALRVNRQAPAVGGVALKAAVDYLGLTPAQLRAQRAAGKSFAQIADATPGRSEQGLVAAIVRAEQQVLHRSAGAGTTPTGNSELEAAARVLVQRPPARHDAGGHHSTGQAAESGSGESESGTSGAAREGG
jgi:hypothetical protein